MNQQLGNLGTLHVCGSCVAKATCGLLTMKAGISVMLWLALGNLFLIMDWLCYTALIHGEYLVLWQFDMPYFVDTYEWSAPF